MLLLTVHESLRHATQAVILRLMSGGFRSPKDSRKVTAADERGMTVLRTYVNGSVRTNATSNTTKAQEYSDFDHA